jgi:hypothetical protein
VVPLAYGLRWLGGLPQVRAFVALLVTLYLIESLLWTLHSVRGLAFHTLSAFFPFGIALAVAGGERWFSRRPATLAAVAATATLAGGAAVSVSALMEWDRAFNAPFRARLAALDAVPPGPIVAIDAAAWRWISGRPAVITPADSLELGVCAADAYGAGSLILEPAHFSAYDALYRGGDPPLGLGFPMRRPAAESGEIRIYPVVRGAECAVIWRDP